VKHIDAKYHVRGEAEFVDDVRPPSGMLFAAVLGSPVACGSLNKVSVEAAAALDGVWDVITAADIPGENQVGPIIQDEPLLANETVHFVGQPIAVVVATSSSAARRALALIELEIDEREPVTDPRIAFEAGDIIGSSRTFATGDVDKAWADCDFVVEGTCDIGGQEHVYMETQRSRAIPVEGHRMLVFASTQGPYAAQKGIARVLGIRNSDVEIDVRRIGGGFGGKEDQSTIWACLAALAAWKTGLPVELVLRRDEDMRMTGKRHPYKSDFKIGASSDGKILAYEARHFQNAGATADLSLAVLERTLFHSTNAYNIPHVRVFGASCRTNLPSNTAFRGFGGPQGMFVIESAIAKLADAMGLSCTDIQRANLLQDGDSFPYGQIVENGNALRTWDGAVERFDLAQTQADVAAFNNANYALKRGVAVMPVCFGISFTTTWLNQASALVHVYTDGSVAVTTGGVEMGQGLSTNIMHIAARAFGISDRHVRIESTNTTRIANMSASAASSTTVLNGNATLVAVRQIRDRLLVVAREKCDLSRDADVDIRDGQVFANGLPTSLNWEQLIETAYLQRVPLSAHGFYATPGIHFDKTKEKGRPFAYHTYGTAIVEVTVDCLRGTYDVDRVKIMHDLGRPLNYNVDLGQVEGGLAQGLGWMTMEDLRYDARGKLLSGALATYKVPDAYFMPDDIQVEFLEDSDETTGPFGNKAVGEPPLMYGIGVWFAIRAAMRAFKPDIAIAFDAPMTPERVLTQLYADDSVLA